MLAKKISTQLFSYLYKKGNSPNQQRTGSKVALVVTPDAITNYFKKPVKNLYIVSPLIGINSYDKFMAGVVVTNLKLPPSKFNFLLASLYSSGAKKINGLGGIWYSFVTDKTIRRIDLGLNAAKFSMDGFAGEEK